MRIFSHPLHRTRAMNQRHSCFKPARAQGFTYLGLLLLIALLGLSASATVTLGVIVQRRAAEEELLRIGSEMRAAIFSYSRMNTGLGNQYPPSLEALLKDPRFAQTRRHLRQIYIDPLTGKADWGLIQAPDGGIAGIYSKSSAKPIKIANFAQPLEHFANAQSYRDWKFMVQP
jgi:type II secretory pathway pseudopilin PulG